MSAQQRVEQLTITSNLSQIAADLAPLLADLTNTDIIDEFPLSVQRYTGSLDHIIANLQETVADRVVGLRQNFVVFSGTSAVGMAIVRCVGEVPDGIDPAWPNLSGFVCNPYRGQGLGRLSLATRLSAVTEDFDGHAWTKVKRSNVRSQQLVASCGFTPINQQSDSISYAYHAK